MKKQFKIISVLIAPALLLSGCAGKMTQNAPEPAQDDITVSESISLILSETETSAEESKITDDTSETDPKETTYEPQTDGYPENTYKAEFPVPDIDMGDYKGSFYQWDYDNSIVSDNAEDFSSQEVEAAQREAERYYLYLIENSEKFDNSARGYSESSYDIKLIIPGYDRNWNYPVYEDDYNNCLNGDFNIDFSCGCRKDFDGDGEEESFYLFCKTNAMYNPIMLTVFVNAKGEARALENTGLLTGSLEPIAYNGFTHMAIHGGYNNLTTYTEIYAVENGEAVLKLQAFSLPQNYKDVFMRMYMVQRIGEWLVFWNEEMNEYCSLAGDPISEEEAEELFEAYNKESAPADQFYGRFKSAEALRSNTRKFDNVYCIDSAGDGWLKYFFEKSENGFTVSDNWITPAEKEFTEIYAGNLDFDTIGERTIPLS